MVSSLGVIYVLKKFISPQVDLKWGSRGHSTGFGTHNKFHNPFFVFSFYMQNPRSPRSFFFGI